MQILFLKKMTYLKSTQINNPEFLWKVPCKNAPRNSILNLSYHLQLQCTDSMSVGPFCLSCCCCWPLLVLVLSEHRSVFSMCYLLPLPALAQDEYGLSMSCCHCRSLSTLVQDECRLVFSHCHHTHLPALVQDEQGLVLFHCHLLPYPRPVFSCSSHPPLSVLV